MSFNINTSAVIIEGNVTVAAQGCIPASTGTNDDLFKLASASGMSVSLLLTGRAIAESRSRPIWTVNADGIILNSALALRGIDIRLRRRRSGDQGYACRPRQATHGHTVRP